MLKQSLAAAVGVAAGVGCVGFGTKKAIATGNILPFCPTKEEFDQSTFKGRYLKMLTKCDPSLVLIESESSIHNSEKILKEWKEEQTFLRQNLPTSPSPSSPFPLPSQKFTDEELWKARILSDSAVHPDTEEIVPAPFRMSGFVPYNGPICVCLLLAKSTPALLFWNWVNQSHNALVNFFNRNASSKTSNSTMLISYCGAVGAALSVAFGLSTFVGRRFSPEKAKLLMPFIAFPSSMVASSSNCYIMRRPEIEKGALLTDKDGNMLSEGKKSPQAAKKAVKETVLSRVILQFPVFLAPALIMSLPPIVRLCTTSPALGTGIYGFVSIVCFGFGLPAAIAVFPQRGSIQVDELEDEFEFLKEKGHEVVYYNKGL